MKSAEPKSSTSSALQRKSEARPFFQQEESKEAFFGPKQAETPFFQPVPNNPKPTSPNPSPPTIQTKLKIGAPDDHFEKEADATAEKVVQRLAEKPGKVENTPTLSPKPATTTVQRKCATCEQEEQAQAKEEDLSPAGEQVQMKPIFDSAAEPPPSTGNGDEIRRKPIFESNLEETAPSEAGAEGNIQRKCAECAAEENEQIQKAEDGGGTEASYASPDVASRLQSSKGGGSALPDNTRADMEGAFGADFSNVRIHTGSAATGMSKDLNAQAFTHGRDIYFNEGKYDAGSTEGKKLLAHELTHTVQQGGGIRRAPTGLITSPEVRIESNNATEREAALIELTNLNNESAWRTILLAHDSSYIDTRERVLKTISKWLTSNTAFNQFVVKMANNPQGLLSDIAVGILVSNRLIGRVDIENYRNVVAQNLAQLKELIENFNARVEANLPYLSFIANWYKVPVKWLTDSVTNIKQYKIKELVALGKKTSTLIMRFSMLMDHIGKLDELMKQHGSNGVQTPATISQEIAQALTYGSLMAGDKSDEAFQKLIDAMAKWPNNLANALAEDIIAGLNDIKKQLNDALKNKPLPSFKKAWNDFKAQVIQPLIDENEKLLAIVQKDKPLATTNPDVFFEKINKLSPFLESVMDRALYVLQAENMMIIYTDLNLTDDAAKDLHLDTSQTLKLAFSFFATLAAERNRDPVKAKKLYEEGIRDPRLKQALQDVDDWHKILDGEFRFIMLLGDVVLIIASIYSGGAAGGLARGGMRLLLGKAATTLAGRAAIAIAVWGAEATAFHISHRALRSVAFGNKFMDDTFWEEYKNTLVLFGVLKAGGYMYQNLLAPKFAKVAMQSITANTAIAVGKQISIFSFFQAWTIGTHWYKTGDLIGPGDRRFWDLAVQNAIFLAAVQLGMAATKSFQMPPDTKVPQDWIKTNNEYARILFEDLQAWKNSRNPTEAGAIDLVKRARLIVSQRLAIYRRIKAEYPSELSAQDFATIEATLNDFLSSVDRVLAFHKAGVKPSESQSNTYYYQGEFKLLEASLAEQGYKLVMTEPTGRAVLKNTTTGHTITLVRSTKLLPAESSTTAVSDMIVDSGYDWDSVKTEFGSNGEAVPNQLLKRAWERNWRPGQPVPKDIQHQRDQYYVDKKNAAETTEKGTSKEPEEPNKTNYDPTTKTEAELIADGDSTPRSGETLSDANERVRLSNEERLRRKMDIYESLGTHPPEIDLVNNDATYRDKKAHTLDRHRWDIPLKRSLDVNGQPDRTKTIEGRVYGDSPWNEPDQGGQQNASAKWNSLEVLNETVNEYLKTNWDAIRSDLVLNGIHENVSFAGKIVGTGYRNAGTKSNPNPIGPSLTDMFTIRIRFLPGPPPSFFILTTFPLPRNIH